MSDNSNSPTVNNCQSKLQRLVMLVDDSEADRATYRRYLQSDAKYQYIFVEAETGEEAWKLYRQSKPDLILLRLSITTSLLI